MPFGKSKLTITYQHCMLTNEEPLGCAKRITLLNLNSHWFVQLASKKNVWQVEKGEWSGHVKDVEGQNWLQQVKKNNSNENGVHSKLNSVKGIKDAKTYVTCPKAAKAL